MNENVVINIIAKSDKFKSEADKTTEKLDKIKRAAYSANLSLLFAGAALQRIASQMITFGTKAYDDISHSIVGTITANDRLQGSMMYLGYTIGEALQPLIEFLIPIIEAVATWVDDNQTLVMGVIALAAAFGTLLVLSSSVQLFTMSLMALTSLAPLFNPLALALIPIGVFLAATISNPLLKSEFVSNILNPLKKAWDSVVDAFKELFNLLDDQNGVLDTLAGILFFIGGIMVNGIAMAITVVLEAVKILIKAWTALIQVMSGDTSGAKESLKEIGEGVANITKSIGNTLKNDFLMIGDLKNGISLSSQISAKEDRLNSESRVNNAAENLKQYTQPITIQNLVINNPSGTFDDTLNSTVSMYRR